MPRPGRISEGAHNVGTLPLFRGHRRPTRRKDSWRGLRQRQSHPRCAVTRSPSVTGAPTFSAVRQFLIKHPPLLPRHECPRVRATVHAFLGTYEENSKKSGQLLSTKRTDHTRTAGRTPFHQPLLVFADFFPDESMIAVRPWLGIP